MVPFKKAKQITLPKKIVNAGKWLSNEADGYDLESLRDEIELKEKMRLAGLHMYLYDVYGQEAVDYVKSIDASARTIEKMIKRGRIY